MTRLTPHPPGMIPAIAPDGSLYPVEKMAAHRRALRHQAISVFIFQDGALLIQQRAVGKYHCPGLWANTVCSHPHWGEDHGPAAERRLWEELGASLPLHRTALINYRADVGQGLVEHEEVVVFKGEAPADFTLAPRAQEVQATRWAHPTTLKAEAIETPERFAPWFRIYLERWDELGL
jgi:isopentenyl-diphosphate delta-isomerase